MSWVFFAVIAGVAAMLVHDEAQVRDAANELAKRILGSTTEHVSIDEGVFPPSLRPQLVRVVGALEHLGFETLGDFDVTEPFVRNLGVHQLARLFVSADRRTYAALACVVVRSDGPTTVSEDFRLQLVSELEDGRFLYTLESEDRDRPLDPPELEHHSHPIGTEVAELCRLHRDRLDGEVVIAIHDLDELIASQRRENELRRRHRVASAKRGLTRKEVRALGGPDHAVLSRRLARHLRRRIDRPGEF